MSSSYSCEMQLRELAEVMHREAFELEQAADLLAELRNDETYAERTKKLKGLKTWAKSWMENV